MSFGERRIDFYDGVAYTFPEIVGFYRRQGWNKTRIQRYWSKLKPGLRFSQGDRVLCNMGPRRFPGIILSTNNENPEDPDHNIPYVVKTDNLPGVAASDTILAPDDIDELVCRERCFNSQSELDLAKWAAPMDLNRTKPLRFSLGDIVGIRVMDCSDGYERWKVGKVVATWPALPCAATTGFLKSATAVPYKIQLQEDFRQLFYCHRDEHTLVRRPENIPQTPTKTISQRFEKRRLENGLIEKFDHVTLLGKIIDWSSVEKECEREQI